MMYSLLIFCYMFFTCSFSLFFFFFNDTATTEIYTLSLHDALPISWLAEFPLERVVELHVAGVVEDNDLQGPWIAPAARSEEHTSELQSHSDLVCRLLLEKKKKKIK